ncbi:MAG: hypothetical protein ABIF19_21695 [Planctomycetota bacterium]
MGVQEFSENVLLITLPVEPQQGDELEKVKTMLSEEANRDIIVDFSKVKILTSESLSDLMILDRILGESRHFMVLCNVPSKVQHIFVRTGLAAIFEFTKDELAALQYIRSESHSPVAD